MGAGKIQTAMRCVPFAILLATVVALVYFSWEPPAAPKPHEVAERHGLPSCGDAAPRPGSEPLESLTPAVIDCLSQGRQRDGGEFALTLYTTEGDPIVYYLRAAAGASEVEVLVDSSQDQFGGGPGWRRITCSIADLSPDLLRNCMAGY
ncbi:hypothetical protein ERC79_13740 [Rhodococcus sp. ABRD24]|uniref:hypothetical protein n=1 Tax=Rhodococcus sp. ABRD24 TaxID=2507582 RepID=UPI00103E6920|nr:hypothetical protein [Rhodococcus sp. ABRD24]QBJ96891.1 hypothetical protein ERC79_13740 [Rhodococcus sp. ABRD24]